MHFALRPVFVINPVKMGQGGRSGRSIGEIPPTSTQPCIMTLKGIRGDVKDIHALLCRRLHP